ncbi:MULTISPECIES: acyl-CoA synthetase FdrA [unclassified Gilliamella]|uniref:acyl-CoA synthetase FdrA n=1 Tax=unclassified Gilliamella TaxID=2685620 RepID=UPI00226A976B|nr:MULTISPECIES: acyl-CoA synthetase FdrA [unclassified Gilliamella]MCX8602445.1 acyl-CoA synthetase FdrA [Gilliamella sp. B3722]MCX8608028.1 acyl-CoA synthetase FdrA [Gilliamella sp. B3771]MCX8611604.1 acyl-CoA synthetase FdrA [Gilliamella sp. B3891]MCX8614128.1 acyl-CoA synthetase FdrA [Gilliamella sp. B3773]MCX8621396.1 acyl-CoA synthetase FdrA [Gilliamella sp. B3892]
MIQSFIKKGSFQDSVSLMLISKKLSNLEEVDEVSVMMGTPANKSLLNATGFWSDTFNDATPNDICVAIKTHDDSTNVIALISDQLEDALKNIAQQQQGGTKLLKARRYASATEKLPDANLILISIAGEYAAELADQALDDNKNVMIFSDNVSVDDEVRLKTKADKKDLIVMGPDCGTAIIAGAPLAFANVIPKGNIGVIGASGTGIQEVISQIALLNQGITQAIGLGGRDLSEEVGGISALTALKMLAADESTQVITFISKPPAENVRKKVITAMKQINKPIVALFLASKIDQPQEDNIYFANTLDEAARLACLLAKVEAAACQLPTVAGKTISGLYTGGTLAAEVAMFLAKALDLAVSHSHDKGIMLDQNGHKIIDLGDDFYTVGRPHPMIDPSIREEEIAQLGQQPAVGVVLMDLVIGYGANADPAESVISGFSRACAARSADNPLIAIVTVTGSEQDPQSRHQQIEALKSANIIVMDNLPEAVLLAKRLITAGQASTPVKSYPLLSHISVINAGLRSFAEDLQASNIPVVQYQWAPIAGGNKKLAAILKKLN